MSDIKDRFISVRGAKVQNLKNVSVDIPRNRFTVVSGVSGSGKSSLAFDTVYAEGQRRFVESLSSYARQFLERMDKPDVELIAGLPPAIAIKQLAPSRNPRSTVGTSTEIYDYLRLLFARIGTTICRSCGKIVKKDSPDSIVKDLDAFNEGDKLFVLFRLNPAVKSIKEEISRLKAHGFFRIILNNSTDIIDIEQEKMPIGLSHEDFFILVDRLVFHKDKESLTRLTDSIESAFGAGAGRLTVKNLSSNTELNFSNSYECADCEILYEEPEPRLFSFNNPQGACPHCQGFGRTIGIDEDLVIPDKSMSLGKGAIHPFRSQGFAQHQRALLKIAQKIKMPVQIPYIQIPEEFKKIIWEGKEDYIGINGFFAMLEEKNYKVHYRILQSKYRGFTKCKACGGSRLRTSARQVFIDGKNIPDLVNMPLEDIHQYMMNLNINEYQHAVADALIKEIRNRLGMLVDIGLGYLTLSRMAHTLSGGEAQRINLATALGSALVGTLYVLDEPSIGLHPRDTNRLINILIKLRNLGNTILVVEHDPDIIRKADMIIDMGPMAGNFGGELVYSGKVEDLHTAKRSLTALYLTGQKQIELPAKRRKTNGNKITIFDASENNLKIDKVDFPLNCLTVVTGVSGSGKSTLVHNILYAGLKKASGNSMVETGKYSHIQGAQYLDFIEMVDQSSIGKSSRSTPATYTKVFDSIRELYSQTQAARQLGWKPGHFSFNVAGGRCEVCEGEGNVTVEMQFLPDVHLTCEACKGTRYKKEAIGITIKDKSIVDVLNMSVDEALEFFEGYTKITKKLALMKEVGLGYLKLGQPSSMLSGGESQRVKLASHLESSSSGNTLFIFDEPTTGLHLDDISKLLSAIQRLVDSGNSVIIIEHNLHIISAADWIIDLGPEAGENGGTIVVEGAPDKVIKSKNSLTGKALKEFFENNNLEIK